MNGLGTMWRAVRPPLAVSGILFGQMVHAIRRPDLPYFPDQDPSGTFGHPDLPPLRITLLGDSVVTAPGCDPLDACWARRTAIHLSERFHIQLISVAEGGSRVADVVDGQIENALSTEPDLVYVAVGGNDVMRGTPLATFERAFSELIGRLHHEVELIACSGVGDLGTIPRLPAIVRGVLRVRGRSFDHGIARVAAAYEGVMKSVTWGPGYTPFEYDISTFSGDQFHASASGHALFAEYGSIPVTEKLLARFNSARQGRAGSSS